MELAATDLTDPDQTREDPGVSILLAVAHDPTFPAAHAAAGPSPVMLAISLIFGVGQIAVGAGLVIRGLRGGRWRRLGIYATMVLGAWFMCSGAVELFVSALTATSDAWGQPTSGILARLRADGDVGLVWASLALVALACLYPVWLFWLRRAPRHRTDP
jgi:hypothetical protein